MWSYLFRFLLFIHVFLFEGLILKPNDDTKFQNKTVGYQISIYRMLLELWFQTNRLLYLFEHEGWNLTRNFYIEKEPSPVRLHKLFFIFILFWILLFLSGFKYVFVFE